MDTFVARQPIFDRTPEAVAYELLFREGMDSRGFGSAEPDDATRRVVAAWIFASGMERLTANKPGFVNFTRSLLIDDPAGMLDPQSAVIEIVEDVEPDAEVLAACRDLKQHGFRIALDDFDGRPELAPFLDVADYLKIDFLEHGPEERAALARAYADPSIALIAEKVETHEQFDEAKQLGFEFFQGHFFAVPEVVRGRHLPIPKLHHLRVVREINKPQFRFDDLAEIVHRDASLSYRLLRYINSAAFGWRTKVRSIRHALVLLGEREIRRWATLAALGSVAEDRPQELVTSSVIRGRLCEMLADRVRMPERAMDLFFLGMLSRFDVIVGCPMEEVLESVDLPEDVRATLLDPDAAGALRDLLNAVSSYEEANWSAVETWCMMNRISREVLPALYVEAVEWAEALHRSRW